MKSKFNSNYRILWNKSLKQWVVAHEHASSRGSGTSSGAVSRSLCAVLLVGAMLFSAPEDASALTGTGAAAAICTGTAATIGGTISGTCAATLNDTLTISPTGTLTRGATDLSNIDVAATSTGVTIDNSGLLTSSTGASNKQIILVNTGAARSAILNRPGAEISNLITSGGRIARSKTLTLAAPTIISNDGLITASNIQSGTTLATATAIAAVGMNIPLTNSSTGTISAIATLNGTIKGTYTIRALAFNGNTDVVLSNVGTISATATNNQAGVTAAALAVSASAIRTTIGIAGSVTNSGTISASAINSITGIVTSSIAIAAYAFSGSIMLGGSLTNTATGTISAIGANDGQGSRINILAVGVNISTNMAGTLTNQGTISSTVRNSGGPTSRISGIGVSIGMLPATGLITNSGTISAGITGAAPGTSVNINALMVISMRGGSINNSGTIQVTGTAGNRYALNILTGFSSTGGIVNNQAGGLISGHIRIADVNVAVNNAGIIEIPDNMPVSSIAGSLTQKPGGVLRIGAISAGNYGQLAVTGTADVSTSPNIDVKVDPANTLAAGDVLAGVLSAGTLVPATTYTVTDDSAAWNFTAALNAGGTGIDLTVVAAPPTPPTIKTAFVDNGGCTLGSTNGSIDPVLPLAALGALILGWFRRSKKDNAA